MTLTLNSILRLCLLAALVVFTGTSRLTAASTAPVVTNDNRSPAGELRDGVLTIHLEVGEGQWHPGSDDGEALPIYAFGETGRPLQIPGPAIRVPQGTEIRAVVHNSLPVAASVHGLHQRPGDNKSAALALPPGATQEVRFQAGVPGTYYYWAATTNDPVATRTMMDTQLSGALVIDPPGAPTDDHIFVLGLWFKPVYRAVTKPPDYREVAVINGKMWPYTERLTVHKGDLVRWHWINTSDSGHGMHLHGFYYHLDATGDGEKSQVFSEEKRPLIVTHHVRRGMTFDMSWSPDRTGRWLFHCHMIGHMSASPMAPMTMDHAAHGAEMDHSGMGGMVLGVTVLPAANQEAVAKPPAWHAERKLQLVIDNRKGTGPLYAVTVQDPARPSRPSQPPAAAPLIGPPIFLTSGQPVEIEVVNHLKESTTMHWHGIELESYYDGVPGWGGDGKEVTPPVEPGKSFVARMAPPHAGTFIYHTHWHDAGQLANGIYGPLIVMPPGQNYDPVSNKIFAIGVGDYAPLGEMVVINGFPQPPVLPLKVGVKYRFRFINITPDSTGLQIKLLRGGVPVQWRSVAKDGADLPPSQSVRDKADILTTVGETYDFEYQAEKPEDLSLEIVSPEPRARTMQILAFEAP